MMNHYTKERWLKLTKIIEHVSNNLITPTELRNICSDMEEWNFITERLTTLGMMYFTDLGPTEDERRVSMGILNLVKRKGTKSYRNELLSLLKPRFCRVGLPLITKTEIEEPLDFFSNLQKPDFYLQSQFVENEDGNPVFLMIDSR